MIVVPARGTAQRIRPPGDGIEVLVIDRQPLFLAALASLLKGREVASGVTTVLMSDTGCEIAKNKDIDLVCCELNADPISGLGVIEMLAAEKPGLPVILLGDANEEAQLADAMAANVAGLFTKNSDPDEFIAGVNAVMSGHRAVCSGVMSHLFARSSAIQPRHGAQRLSHTELEILAMIGRAQSIRTIAASRGISHKTVRNHLAKIYRKLELHGRTEAVLWAARMGISGP